MLTEILQLLIYGILLGSVIALGAVGVSLIFGILRFAHFAHGDLMTAGAYFALFFMTATGASIWLAFPFAVLGAILVALAFDRVVYRRLRRTRPVILLIASIGVAFILRNAVLAIWGPDITVYESGIKPPLRFLGLRIKEDQLLIIVGAVLLVILLSLFLQRTRMGKAMRAMADDPDLARITGIDTDRVILWTWVIGAGLAAAGGVFLALDTRLQPTLGWDILLAIFAATILGGIGKPYGAIAGAMVVGISAELGAGLPGVFGADWSLTSYKPAITFLLMVAMLLWRPQGLIGGRA